MALSVGVCLKHYKRPEIQEAMLAACSSREVAVKYGEKGFGKRPDVLQHPKDILEFVKQGATSFHVSEEIWLNPLQLDPRLAKQELDALRRGWDLIIDIDCKSLEVSKVAAYWVIEFFRSQGVRNISVKFSGNHGFHIGLPHESFPEELQTKQGPRPTRELFPEAPRKIASYLASRIKAPLAQQLLSPRFGLDFLQKNLGKRREELVRTVDGISTFDPFQVITIDTVLIASRHLFRMPYSINEKSGWVSITIDPSQILTFDPSWAYPENVKAVRPFWNPDRIVPGEAERLLRSALDFEAEKMVQQEAASERRKPLLEMTVPETALAETLFPPCMEKLKSGIVDGKKRALFMLINFLGSVGWSHEQIEAYARAWNSKNPEPLHETYLIGQLRYAKMRKSAAMPPNCAAAGYYREIGICNPDNFCQRIKNPVQYAKRKALRMAREAALNAAKSKGKKKNDVEPSATKPAEPKQPTS